MVRVVLFVCFGFFVFAQEIPKVLITPPTKVTIPLLKDPILQKISFSVKKAEVKPFLIGKYEITKEQIAKAKGEKLPFDAEDGDDPAVNVTYEEAQNVCHFYKGRLPTEIEWIVAAGVKVAPSKCYEILQQGKFYPYATANYPIEENSTVFECFLQEDDELESALIGSELNSVEDSYENINGTYGMLGNVWEWVDAKRILFHQEYRIVKGGSFANANVAKLYDVRISNPLKATTTLENVGFRCVWDKK